MPRCIDMPNCAPIVKRGGLSFAPRTLPEPSMSWWRLGSARSAKIRSAGAAMSRSTDTTSRDSLMRASVRRHPSGVDSRRQRQSRDGAAAFAREELDGPSVQLRDLTHDRETETGTRLRSSRGRAIEAIEDPGSLVARDADAAVAHFHDPSPHVDFDRRVRRAELARIVEQVVNGAIDRGDPDVHDGVGVARE